MRQGDRGGFGVNLLHRAFGLVAHAGDGLGTGGTLRGDLRTVPCMSQAPDGSLEVAFRIDEEVGGHHHHLAIPHALDDFDAVLAARADLDFAGLETPLLELHQNDLPCSAVDDGRRRHRQDGPLRGGGQFHLGKHARLQQSAWIGQFNPHGHGAGFRRERGIDVGDGTGEYLVRVGVDANRGLCPCFDHADVLLEYIGYHPH